MKNVNYIEEVKSKNRKLKDNNNEFRFKAYKGKKLKKAKKKFSKNSNKYKKIHSIKHHDYEENVINRIVNSEKKQFESFSKQLINSRPIGGGDCNGVA